jgi:hypothetical protein
MALVLVSEISKTEGIRMEPNPDNLKMITAMLFSNIHISRKPQKKWDYTSITFQTYCQGKSEPFFIK